MNQVHTPWAMEQAALEKILESDTSKGLTFSEAHARLNEAGKNSVVQRKPITFWAILKEEILEPMILLLLVIGVMYSLWGDIGDTIIIICVILTVSLVEVYTEFKAKKHIESLKTLALPTTWILREGQALEVETSLIVPGDILILKSGVRVGADARIVESVGLEADESVLTGESMGIAKTAGAIAAVTNLNDRVNMVHAGTVILKGQGKAIVTATGMDTELGRITGLTEEAREPKTPLQKSMKALSKTLIWGAAFFSVLIAVLGILQGLPDGMSVKTTILTGLSFAFAVIPEEMPIIITMVLGLGAIKLAKHHVLIKRTKAAETLGRVTVIAADKTGTLTENRMSIAGCFAEDETLLLRFGVLMADVACTGTRFLGDPMDKSVIEKAIQYSIERNLLLETYPVVKDYGFDEEKRIFQRTFQHGEQYLSIIKGSPESVFTLACEDTARHDYLNQALSKGLRTIAVAYKVYDTEESEEPYSLAGLICFEDPIRQGVRDAITSCTEAGIRVVMITGDHASTAKIAAEHAGIAVTGLLTGDALQGLAQDKLRELVKHNTVFARISPEQKLAIVTALRENGEIIGVTGDGINDAPALKAADIGISLGTGTEVAKEAADMILTDNSFASILYAVAEGRRLFDNLSKCVTYYLACKIALILSMLVPVLLHIPLPFAPIQIIILELFMDLAASTSFVVESAEPDILKRKPVHPKEPFMNHAMITGILSGGVTLALIVLGVYLYLWFSSGDILKAQTYSFVVWLLGHVCLAFNMRTSHSSLIKTGIFSSAAFTIWMIGVILFLAAVLNIPILRDYLHLTSISLVSVLLLGLIALAATSWMEIGKLIACRRIRLDTAC